MILVISKMSAVAMLVGCFVAGCKRQPVRSAIKQEDVGSSKFFDVVSADGNLKSAVTVSALPPCSETGEQPFYFTADSRSFYRCINSKWEMLPVSSAQMHPCRSFDLLVDVAETSGASPELNVKFLGMMCDGRAYLVKEENGLVPVLSSASINLGDKEITLRSTYFQGKGESSAGEMQPAVLFLERPTAITWSSIPKAIEVSPGGSAGVGHLALLALNSDRILCSYRSDTRQEYRLIGCWEGAQVDRSGSTGLQGGVALDLESKSLLSLDAVKFSILTAEPGFITGAVLILSVQ